MQEEIEQGNRRLRRFFFLFNLSWLIVSIVALVYSAIGAFSTHPEYLHSWQAPVIFLFMVLVLTFFFIIPLIANPKRLTRNATCSRPAWPPPLGPSLAYWAGLFLTVSMLNVLNNNFVWAYFIVLGLTFGLFNGKIASALVALIFLAYCWFQSILSWPLTGNHIDDLFGSFITFASITIMCLAIQRLTRERHERENVFQQLARSNKELEEAHSRLAETVAQEQELAVLRERTRLAREMHDTLGHALVLVSVKLEAAQRLRERDPQRCDHELEVTKEIVRDSMKELRASIANLRSPALEREPACRALSRYAREMAQRGDLRVSYDLHPDIEGLPEPIEETLWKVGQEALANIEKHARARNVLLHISRQNSQVHMKIQDDGVGLPADLCQRDKGNSNGYESPSGHYGLNGMQERVKNMRGQLSIHSNSERGTTIEISLPLVEAPLLTA